MEPTGQEGPERYCREYNHRYKQKCHGWLNIEAPCFSKRRQPCKQIYTSTPSIYNIYWYLVYLYSEDINMYMTVSGQTGVIYQVYNIIYIYTSDTARCVNVSHISMIIDEPREG